MQNNQSEKIQLAIGAIRQGRLVQCNAEDYEQEIRKGLQDFAAKMIDCQQIIYAQFALNEVKRLDNKFNFTMNSATAPAKGK